MRIALGEPMDGAVEIELDSIHSLAAHSAIVEPSIAPDKIYFGMRAHKWVGKRLISRELFSHMNRDQAERLFRELGDLLDIPYGICSCDPNPLPTGEM